MTEALDAPVAVTGASGYLASWIVAQLLDEGHRVHATVRRLADAGKVQHLRELAQRHPGRLALFEADLMTQGSFDRAFEGCGAVIHTASPYVLGRPRDFQGELLGPARQGSLNVMGSVNRAPSVRRLVLTASAVSMFSKLGLAYRRPEQTFHDHVAQLVRDRLVEP